MEFDRDRIQKTYLVTVETARHIQNIAERWGGTGGEVIDTIMRQFRMQKGRRTNDHRRSTGNQHP